MNIMMFSLLLYSDAFTGVDAEVLPWIHLVLWIFATPAVLILGGPYFRETWLDALQGRVTSSALIVLGVAAAYLYSAFAVFEGSTPCLFRHRLDGADAVHAWPLSRGGRPRPGGARPRTTARRRKRERDDRRWRRGNPPPGARGDGGHAGQGAAGRAHSGRRRRRRGRIQRRRGGDHRRKPAGDQGRRLHGDRRQHQHRRAAARPQQRRRHRDPLGADLPVGARGARPPQPDAAPCRPRRRRVGAAGAGACRTGGRLLGAVIAVRPGDADRPRRAGGRLSLRGRPRRADGDIARHRPAGAARLPCPRSRRARDPCAACGSSPSTRPAR